MRKEHDMRRIIGSLVAAFAAMAMVASVGLTPVSAAGQVPFKGQFSGSLSFAGPSTILLNGSGTASKLGNSTNASTVEVVGPAACANGFRVHSVETLTAADGDELTWTVDGDACPTDATLTVFRISGPYTVVGGTGRFAGATGSGTIECLGDFANGRFAFTVTGTVSQPLD
jgi:hypothetical protein